MPPSWFPPPTFFFFGVCAAFVVGSISHLVFLLQKGGRRDRNIYIYIYICIGSSTAFSVAIPLNHARKRIAAKTNKRGRQGRNTNNNNKKKTAPPTTYTPTKALETVRPLFPSVCLFFVAAVSLYALLVFHCLLPAFPFSVIEALKTHSFCFFLSFFIAFVSFPDLHSDSALYHLFFSCFILSAPQRFSYSSISLLALDVCGEGKVLQVNFKR